MEAKKSIGINSLINFICNKIRIDALNNLKLVRQSNEIKFRIVILTIVDLP